MCTPVRSWRQTMGRIPATAEASIRGLEGIQQMKSTPSNFRMLAIAVTPSIAVLLVILAGFGEPAVGTADASHQLSPLVAGDYFQGQVAPLIFFAFVTHRGDAAD